MEWAERRFARVKTSASVISVLSGQLPFSGTLSFPDYNEDNGTWMLALKQGLSKLAHMKHLEQCLT